MDTISDFSPLDSGCVDIDTPRGMRYWCKKLECTPAELEVAISNTRGELPKVKAKVRFLKMGRSFGQSSLA